MLDFKDIREIAENKWQAKYHGNYGIYTVKLTLNANGRRTDFSCSCPSDYYPCKHIAMMEEAVAKQQKRIAKIEKTDKAISVAELLKRVSEEELREFIVRQSKYNPEFTNALMMEFLHKAKDEKTNPYYGILHNALKNISFDYEDYYDYEYGIEIEPLDEWLEKAENCLSEKKYEETLLICQACIEEFANWHNSADSFERDYLQEGHYESKPFEILQELVEKTTKFDQKLYDYCQQELQKSTYTQLSEIRDGFNDLLATLSPTINPEEFIALQDKLLAEIPDKKSYEAEKILKRKIQFYHDLKQPEKADEIVENNLQIESFCRQAVEKRIAKKQYTEAKALIQDYLFKYATRHHNHWDEYILDIAQKENDVLTIRKTSFGFISSHFDKKYYTIFRATFTSEEWKTELEKLIQHYEKSPKTYWIGGIARINFNASVADVLVAENATERLLAYIEKSAAVEVVEKYYQQISEQFPEQTLSLFRKTLDIYAANNLGRDKYEYVKKILEKMKKIVGGETVVNEMLTNYRAIYKNRRAMIEILRNC